MAIGGVAEITSKQIQLLEYSDGKISFSDIENMYLEDMEYFIYNYKIIYENKEKNNNERVKSIIEFAAKGMEILFKLLAKIGGGGSNKGA